MKIKKKKKLRKFYFLLGKLMVQNHAVYIYTTKCKIDN